MGIWLYLLFYAAGLAIAPYLPPSIPWLVLALLGGVTFVLLRRSAWSSLPLLLFFVSLGGALYHHELTPPSSNRHIRSFVGDLPRNIEGTILASSKRFGGGAVIDLQAERILQDQTAIPVHGKLRLYSEQGDSPPEIGSRVAFRSRLRAPKNFGVPGEFDYPRHLAYLDIFVTAHVADLGDLAHFAPADSDRNWSIATLRTGIGRRIDTAVAAPLAPLVRALAIGDKGGISPEQQHLLAAGGISHLFAISGLHLGLIAAMLYGFARRLYQRSERLLLAAPPARLLPCLLLPLLLAYLLLTGNAISTRRALVMLLAATVMLLGSRQTPPLKLLTSCAFTFLLIEPLILFQPAFQLSFAGLAGILILVPRWMAQLPTRSGCLRYLIALLFTTLAASLTTTPLVLMNFHLLAPAGLAANLFAVPAVGLVAVPLALAGAITIPLEGPIATALFQGCATIIELTLAGVEMLLEIPALSERLVYAPPTSVATCFLLCATALLSVGSKRNRRLRLLAAVPIALLLWAPPPAGTPKLAVTALSVGQGDATLLSFGGRQHYLIDGGGVHSDHFDTGERLLAPALGWLGVNGLEAVILTHDHPDHRKGLLFILGHFPVREFWTSIPFEELDLQLRQTLSDRGIPMVQPAPGWERRPTPVDGSLWTFVPEQQTANQNDRSLVLLAGYGRDAVLLTGDLEENGVGQLLAKPLPQQANLLKVPHHGSRKSHPQQLLDTIAPTLAFISLGAANSHGFPHPEVVSALGERAIPFWRTDLNGSLLFASDGRGWQATHWNQRLFR